MTTLHSPYQSRAYRVAAGSAALGCFLGLGSPFSAEAQSGTTSLAAETVLVPEVSVQGTAVDSSPPPYAGGQVATGGRLGVLGNTRLMDTPFSTSSYTEQTIRNQGAATVTEALAFDPSVRVATSPGGQVDSVYIRGLPVGEGNLGEIAFDGQYGIAPNYRVFTEYVERLEVLRGPGALLYGVAPNGAIGGVVNIVPKRAGDDLFRFTALYDTNSRFGGQIDFARRFGEQRKWGIRFNGGYRQGDTVVDHQSREVGVVALSLDYRGDRFRASLDLLRQEERINSPLRPFLLGAGVTLPAAPSGRRNVSQPWEWSDVIDYGGLLHAEYDVLDNLTAFANLGGGTTRVHRIFGLPTIVNVQGDVTTTPGSGIFNVDRHSYNGGLRSRFDTGPIRHAVTVQADFYEDTLERAILNGPVLRSNIYAPVVRAPLAVAMPATVPRISTTTLTGVSLADTLSTLDERVLLTLGLRSQHVETLNYNTVTGGRSSSYDESALTPLAGLVVKPLQNVSLYANYIEGLSRGDIAPATAVNAGEAFAPYRSRQYEAGVKVDFGRATATFAAFQITRPIGELNGNVFAVGGEQRVRGLELSSFGEVTRGLRLLGGVTLLQGEITRSATASSVSNEPIGVAPYQANLGIEWDLPWARGLTLKGNVLQTGRQHINTANTASLPAWTRLDIGARYATEIAGRPTTFRASMLNVFDSNYWSGVASFGTFSVGAPRTFLFSAAFDL